MGTDEGSFGEAAAPAPLRAASAPGAGLRPFFGVFRPGWGEARQSGVLPQRPGASGAVRAVRGSVSATHPSDGVPAVPLPQGEVCNMINKKYNEFLPSMQSAEDLVSKVDGLSSNIDLLKAGIENEVTAGCSRCHSIPSQTRTPHLGVLQGGWGRRTPD